MVNFFVAVHILLVVAIALQIYRMQMSLGKYYWPALLFKLIAGVCLGLVYTYYYSPADTFVYYQDASKVASLARSDISSYFQFLLFDRHNESLHLVLTQPRAAFLTKITSVFWLFTGGNYWTIGFYFSFLSFLGSWSLVRVIDRHIPSATGAALAGFLFLPSVVFWTSGLLKESLSTAALFLLSAMFLKIWFREKAKAWHYIVAISGLWILWNLKYYYAGIFVAVVSTAFLYKILVRRRFSFSPGIEALVWVMIFLLPTALVSLLHPNFHLDRLLNVVISNNRDYIAMSSVDNIVQFHNLSASPLSILQNAPLALFSGLFRPMLWEVSSTTQMVAAVENAFLLLLFVGSILNFKRYFYAPHRLLILSVMVYVILLCVFLTFSAPNFGTLSRFRTGYISFFTFIVWCGNPAVEYVERSWRRLVRK